MKRYSTQFLTKSRSLILGAFLMLVTNAIFAQVQLSNGSTTATLDFSNSMPVTVGTNPSTAFTGVGFSPDPVNAGRLNSNAWAVTGWSDGALAFGGTNTAGDYARGAIAVAVTTGGMYSYTGAPQSVSNPCLMLQPGGSDFAPGTLTLRIKNNGSTNITQLAVSYNLYNRNDQARGNSFNFSHSTDNVTYTAVPALDFTSPAAVDALGWVLIGTAPSRSTTITGLNIAPGAFYYIRWNSADVSGSGSRDEFGLDDINIAATFACNLATTGLANVSCDNNGTPNDAADDLIRFDLNPTGAGLGTSYTVTSNTGSIVYFTSGDPATNVPYGVSTSFYVFPPGSAGSGNVTITITDNTSGTCTINDLITDPGTCSVPACDLTDAGLTGVHCENNNETEESDDDFIWFELNPSGTGLGTGYNVTVSSGSVLWNGNTAPNNVPYGGSEFFRLQAGSAGAGDVTVFLADADNSDCVISVLVADPGSCSQVFCNIDGTGLSNVSCEDSNETDSNPNDDNIIFQLNPSGSGLGSGYNVTVSPGTVLLNGTDPASGIAYGVNSSFRMQDGSAGGGNVTVTVTDADNPDCTLDVTIIDPGSCSSASPCVIYFSGLAGLVCNDNDTPTDPADDFISFSLDPFGLYGSTTYSLTVSSGWVSYIGGAPATNIPFGNVNFFRLQEGSAGGGDVTLFITDDSDPDCVFSQPIDDPGVCSQAPLCSLMVSCPPQPAGIYNCNTPLPAAATNEAEFEALGGNISGAYCGTLTVTSTTTSINNCSTTSVVRTYTVFDDLAPQNGLWDAGENVATCTQTFTYAPDQTPPVFTFCPAGSNLGCNPAGVPAPGNATATDACGVPVITDALGSITSNGCLRTQVRTYTATDACGYTATCTQVFTWTADVTPPVFTFCPAGASLGCNPSGFPGPGAATATDGCGTPMITSSLAPISSNGCMQSQTRTYTATDGCGNTATCTQVFTWSVDNTPPSLTCPGPVSVSCSFEVPAPNINLVTGLSDNCTGTPTVIFLSDETSGQTCVNRFTVTRTYKATDACGNMATCSQIITVNDQTAPTFNQSPLPANFAIGCTENLPIAPALSGSDACGGIGSVPDVIWINEIHYDNVGNDVNEFVEVAGTAGINLADYQIILYNGNGGVVYDTDPLVGVIDNEGSGFGAVSLVYPLNGVQNGAPDGVALYRISTNQVIQFLSYEGVFQATAGPANGIFSTDIGVLELGSEPAGLSLQLTGTGQVATDFTWVGPIAQSPGVLNAGQVINPLPSSIAATFMQTEAPGSCAGARIVTRTWTLTDACGNQTVHVQTINVNDNEAPVLTPMPPNVTISCSDPLPAVPVVIATDGCDPAGIVNGPVWINELHYDNTGNDVNEFIEIAGRAGTNLAGYELFFYNGSTGMMGGTYDNLPLTGIIPNQSNGFGTVAFMFPLNGIQNGPSDGIAFVKGGTVLQFLSYEGVMTAVGGPANGMVSTDIGVFETGNEPVGQSLRLSGNGATYAAFVWNGPSATFPATPGQVNQGQTFPVQPPVGLPVTFNQTSTPGSCPQNQTITRTWSASDACGNTTVYTQTISVTDNTAPVVVCKNANVNLDIFGNVAVTQAQVLQSVSDNCAPVNSIVVTPAGPFNFNCAHAGTTQPVVLTATDPCGNSSSCTAQVTINPFERCTPKILISDPCVCKNNATTLTNGQFGETIKIESLAGQTWTIIAVNGLYLANSPAPPAAPIPVTVGMTFTQNPLNSGDYFFTGLHVDAAGYSITVSNGIGFSLTISNSCAYPNPAITADLSGDYCLFSEPVTLTGTPGDANIISEGFTVNGVPATEFDPGQGLGTYVITYTVNGGVPKAFGPDDPGCIQSVSQTVHVISTPAVLNCNDQIYVSLPSSCTGEINPDDILEGTFGCFDDYLVELDRTLPLGNGPWTTSLIDATDIGHTYQVRVTHLVSGNKCWGSVTIEDKIAPQLACEDIHLICPITTYDPAYLSNVLGIDIAYPDISDCSNYTSGYVDTWFDLPCGAGINGQQDISAYVQRKWTATDQWGNSTTCLQYIYFHRLHAFDVIFPAEYAITCGENLNTDPSVTGTPYVEAFGQQWPLYPGAGFCEMQSAYTDQILPVCDGTYKILRTWTVLDWCIPTSPFPPFTNPLYYIQLIKVVDETGPVFTCPANMTVSIDPFQCCATVNMPDRIIEDACSRVNNISGMVNTFDPYTGIPTGMVTFGGQLTDFPGNNWWDRDTLGQWGWTTCLPIGSHTVTYRAQDDCSNISTCTFKLTVLDYIPPVAACDQTTVVGIGYNDPNDCYTTDDGCEGAGVTWVHASTYDDGSYDQCSQLKFTVRRMAPYSDCINNLDHDPCYPNGASEYDIATAESDSIKFYCCEVGTTQTIILRVYQVDVNGNIMNGPDGSPIYNECMVQVAVQDKLKPICQSPSNVTVTCEQFDPSLWLYGKASLLDNCCLDTTRVYQGQCGLTHTVNYAQFDTLCNKGTITRTFRAFDCHGNSSQCTQRIVVTYEQDYYVRFPNDVIVTTCDGTGNYGEPTFFGEDCELLGVSFEDEIFTVVPDACFKIERNWKIINWCTYNPNLVPLCINVPNPNPNAITNHPTNLPGPIVSPIQTVGDPWKSTIVKISPSDALATNYSIYYDPNANCYTYKQIIKIIDTQDPVAECPASPVTICDLTPNDPQLWNAMYWWDNANQSHDLCEAPSDICITATDACSGSNINFEYQLFLDLDGDGVMETVVNSTQLGSQPGGLGWNNILFGNATGAGVSRQFDGRPVPTNQKWGFAIQETVSGNNKSACVKFNTFQAQNTFVTPQLPHGTHKIKWFITDGCGNETICEYTIIIKDCKAPTVVCLNGLSVNIMPTGMIQLWATDFLQYAEDNCTLNPYLKYGIRKCGQGTGFPVDGQGNPITNIAFTCAELGTQCVELWSIDLAGNADYCETYVIVQDNNGSCTNSNLLSVAGDLKTEIQEGIEEGSVEISGSVSFAPPFFQFDLTDVTGHYVKLNSIPVTSDYTIKPVKDDNPLNGVTTYDLVLISKHILGIEPLNSPYKMIAADANKSNSITTFDIVEIRKVILGIYTEFPANNSWRFVDKSYNFPNMSNPFQEPIPETISIANALADQMEEHFVGVKIGDVNNTVVTNVNNQADDRTTGTLIFDVTDRNVIAGEVFDVTFKAAEQTQGFQMTLNLHGLTVSDIIASDRVSAGNFGVFKEAMTVSIDGAASFTVKFRATKSGKLSEMLKLSSEITKAEAYSLANGSAAAAGKLDVALRFGSPAGMIISGVGFELYQNQPNPFVNKTSIGFHLPETSAATLTVYDETGRAVFTQKGDFAKGYNTIMLDRALLNTTGLLYYTLETATDSATKKMIQSK